MSTWDIPNWAEPWNLDFEVPILKKLALLIETMDSSIICTPDFEIEGCAFIELYKNKINIGRICLSQNKNGRPFYSGYFGAKEDEFHGFNRDALLHLATMYFSELPNCANT